MYRIIILSFIISFKSFTRSDTVKIGSKSFTESIILGEILAILLEEKYGIAVERKFGLGGTMIAFEALRKQEIDVYADYTGTGYVMILKKSGLSDPRKIYEEVSSSYSKNFGIKWSKPLGFNNTYALAVRKTDKKFFDIKNISDLLNIPFDFTYAAPHEFMERKDGHEAFTQFYDLELPNESIFSFEAGLMYAAFKEKRIDVGVVYSTDGRIKSHGLRVLEDEQKFFPPYDACYLTKMNTANKKSELFRAIGDLEGMISEKEMMTMNHQSDLLQMDPAVVAKNFLVDHDLIKGERILPSRHESFWSFLGGNLEYVFRLIVEHLKISFLAIVAGLSVTLPLGIFLTRAPRLAKVVFPVVNVIQTIPSLALFGALIPIMGIGLGPAITALFLYSLLPLLRNIYAGINDIDSELIEVSRGIGLTDMQILRYVELPLAIPIMIAGLRTAFVIVIGTTTLAALIGAGGLGDPIFRGISTVNTNLLLLGAIPSAGLAIFADIFLNVVERKLAPKYHENSR